MQNDALTILVGALGAIWVCMQILDRLFPGFSGKVQRCQFEHKALRDQVNGVREVLVSVSRDYAALAELTRELVVLNKTMLQVERDRHEQAVQRFAALERQHEAVLRSIQELVLTTRRQGAF